ASPQAAPRRLPGRAGPQSPPCLLASECSLSRLTGRCQPAVCKRSYPGAMIPLIQTWLFAVLALALFAIEVWAFINALRFRPDAYVAAGKRTKTFWGILTGVAMLLGFLSLPAPIGGGGGMFLFMLGGIIIAGIFLADVLPALKRVVGRSRGNNRRW